MNIKQKNVAFIIRYFASILLLLFLVNNILFAQQKRVLRSHDNMKRLAALHPEIITNRANIEDFIQQAQQQMTPYSDVKIPVVFHVLYNNNTEMISENQVMSQLYALNNDFGNYAVTIDHPAIMEEQFQERMNYMSIQFCLPKLEGNLADSSAINFYSTTRQEWEMNDAMKIPANGGISPWDTDSFLNVWIVDLADSVSGYAQLPGGPNATDGIVIDYEFIGTTGTVSSPYDLGKTMTHLAGNYLGLHSLWGASRCADDYVRDTPIHNAPNYNCPDYKHFSICTGEVEMTMNFMDNSNDECLQFFTTGQMYRLHSFLSPGGPRSGLMGNKTDCPTGTFNEEIVVESRIDNTKNKFQKDKLKIFPNPGRDNINVEYQLVKNAPVNLLVTDLNGKLIINLKGLNPALGTLSLNTTDWSSGVYLVSLRQSGTEVLTEKLIIGNKNK